MTEIRPAALSAGKQSLVWDGRDRNGNTVVDGDYTFEVQAKGDGSEPIAVTTYSRGLVTGVTFEDGITYLLVGRSKVPVGDVTQVGQAPSPTAS